MRCWIAIILISWFVCLGTTNPFSMAQTRFPFRSAQWAHSSRQEVEEPGRGTAKASGYQRIEDWHAEKTQNSTFVLDQLRADKLQWQKRFNDHLGM